MKCRDCKYWHVRLDNALVGYCSEEEFKGFRRRKGSCPECKYFKRR